MSRSGRCFWFVLVLTLMGLTGEATRSASAEVENPEVFRLWIVIQIEGQDVKLAVDTGAETTFLIRSFAEKLKLKIDDPEPGTKPTPGYTTISIAENVKVGLGGGEVLEADFAVVADPPYSDIVGAMGWGWLKQTTFAIDWSERRLVFLEKAIEGGLEGFTSYPLCEPCTLAAFELDETGKNRVYLDTGNFGGAVLSPALWKKWLNDHPKAPRTLEAQYSTSEGVVAAQILWTDLLDLGGLKIPDTPLESTTTPHLLLPGLKVMLGIASLVHFHVVVDGPGQRIYLQPASEVNYFPDYNRAGAVFTPKGPKDPALIASVVEGGPAHTAGVRDGDELLKIGDLDVTRWRSDPRVLPLSRFWSQPAGTRVPVTLRSGGKIRSLQLPLVEIFPRVSGRKGPAKQTP